MIKISKSVEYSLLALNYISENKNFNNLSSRKIANELNIPYDLLAKLLQKLVKNNIVKSQQGKNGGYTLLISPDELSVLKIIDALGENVQLANCTFENASIEDCGRINDCCIRSPFWNLQNKINDIFRTTTLHELTKLEEKK